MSSVFPHGFAEGAHIVWAGSTFRIHEQVDEEHLLLLEIGGEKRERVEAISELERAYASGRLLFQRLVRSPSKKQAFLKPPAVLEMVRPDLRAEAERRHRWVQALRHERGDDVTRSSLARCIEKYSERLEGKPPSVGTLSRWNKLFSQGGFMALIPRTEDRGGRYRRLDDKVELLVAQAIKDVYLDRRRLSTVDVHDRVVFMVHEHNQATGESLHAPSLRTVQYRIKALNFYEVTKNREGALAARRKHHQCGKGIATSRPFERVEIDHTKADIMLVDRETRVALGRPTISVAIDAHTRMIVAIAVSFEDPSYLSVMHCIRMMALPKCQIVEVCGVETPWPSYGLPETLVCDNGKDFQANSLIAASNQLGIELEFTNPMQPEHKGKVERFNRTISQGLAHKLVGATFSNPKARGDNKPEKYAAYDIDEFRNLLFRYVGDVYHNTRHRSLLKTPLAAYEAAVRETPVVDAALTKDDLAALSGVVAERSVHHYGVEYQGLHFNHPDLSELRNRLSKRKTEIRVDPSDLSRIWVWDEFNRRFIEAQCTQRDYTGDGVTAWLHREVRKQLREQGTNPKSEAALQRKRAELLLDADERRRSRKKARITGKRAARRRDGADGTLYEAAVEQGAPSARVEVSREEPSLDGFEGWGRADDLEDSK